MSVIYYTAIFNNYDELTIPEISSELKTQARLICFTDNPELKSDIFEIVLVERKFNDFTRENRYYKIMAHEVLPPHDLSIYFDGNIILKASFESIFEEANSDEKIQLSLLKHPFRDCLYEEGEACIKQKKDNVDIIINQLSRYQKEGYPSHNGLLACTVIFRKNIDAVQNLCSAWWKEIESGSRRDQISLPFVIWKNNFQGLKILDLDWMNNDLYQRIPHKKKSYDLGEINLFSSGKFYLPYRMLEPLAWVGHIPFAIWLVENFRPKIVVELGTHKGNSFFSFCQSMKLNNIKGKVFAIDLWEGDKHAGYYSNSIYEDVKEYAKHYYSDIAELIREDFNLAVGQFEDQSIDLLHIDGLHTYDAVKNDFETWLPKLKPDSIVLFHDISVFRDDFGVNQYWNEIITTYPNNISFTHSNGLGILSLKDNGKGARLIEDLNNDISLKNSLVSTGEVLFQMGPLFFENKQLKERLALVKNSKVIKASERLKKFFRMLR